MIPVDGAADDAWVPGCFKVIEQFLAQSGLGFGEEKRTREVVHLMGVCFEVVELFGRAHPEREFCQASNTVLVTIFHHEGFGGGTVDFTIGNGPGTNRWIGRTGGPAGWFKVMDVKMVGSSDRAAGIAFTTFAAAIVAFHGNEGSFVIFRRLVFKDREKTFCCHHAWWFETGCFEKGGGEVAEIEQGVAGAAGLGDSFGPANGERNAGSVVVEGGFGAGERHAVVAGDDDNGVVELTGFFQQRDGAGYLGIEVFDFDEVVEEVVSDDVVVGKNGWDDDFRGIFAGSFSSAGLEATMGFRGAEPEAEGFFFWRLRKEGGEIAGVVGVAHLFEGRLEALLLVGWSGRVFRAPSGFEATGAPSLASVADRVTGFSKEVGVGGELGWKSAVDVASLLEPPDRLTGEDGGAGGTTSGGVAEGMGEAEALFYDAIKGGSFDDGIAIGSGVGIALIVGDAEENVRPVDGREL